MAKLSRLFLLLICMVLPATASTNRPVFVMVVDTNAITGVVSKTRVPHYSSYRMPYCEWCLSTSQVCNVHHIIPQSTCLSLGIPLLIHDPRNLISLCPTCHVLIGHLGNTSRDNNELAEMIRTKKRLAR